MEIENGLKGEMRLIGLVKRIRDRESERERAKEKMVTRKFAYYELNSLRVRLYIIDLNVCVRVCVLDPADEMLN